MNANSYVLETISAEGMQIPSIKTVVVDMEETPVSSDSRLYTFQDDKEENDN